MTHNSDQQLRMQQCSLADPKPSQSQPVHRHVAASSAARLTPPTLTPTCSCNVSGFMSLLAPASQCNFAASRCMHAAATAAAGPRRLMVWLQS